jgi:prolyl oligopeptidase
MTTFPNTKRENIVEEIHGKQVSDPYRWLENYTEPEVQKWLKEQHRYTEKVLKQIPNRKDYLQELAQCMALDDIGNPIIKGEKLFYRKRTKDENQPILYTQEGLDGEPKELINPNELSTENPIALDWWAPSPNGKYLAYGLSENGDEWSVLHIIDIDKDEILTEKIPRTRACSLAWEPDETGFYYTRFPEKGTVPEGQENYNQKIYYHKLGDSSDKDPLIFGEGKKPTNHYVVELSPNGKYCLLTTHKYVKTDIHLLDREKNEIIPIVEGKESLNFATLSDDFIWNLTNQDAPNRTLKKIAISDIGTDNWEEIIPESNDLIEQVLIANEKIYTSIMHNVTNQLIIYSIDGTKEKTMDLPDFITIRSLPQNWHIKFTQKKDFFIQITSFTHPNTIYYYPGEEEKLTVFKEIKAPMPKNDFTVKQIRYTSKDGTKVPMFIVHKKYLKKNGKNPTILAGYGGFNVAIKPPYLKNSFYFWLKHGGVIAIANLRGGSEFGETWHKAGMLENKQNVFDDFCAAAKWLVDNNYASPETLAAYGRSNGGLLVGAAITQYPELFKAAYSGVPLLDMIRYHKFSIAKFWIPEYGSSDNPNQIDYLLDYSPYHNVEKGKEYPATFFVTAESDSRVDPNHAMKMTAQMQWATNSNEPIILEVERQAGHGVGKPFEKLVESEAGIYLFLGWKTGLLE